jgi:hypothetical protein
LGNIFSTIVEGPQVAELIKLGYLVGTQVYAPYRPDLTGLHIRHGDYAEDELAERMDRPRLVGDIVANWLRLGERRPTVVFTTNVSHSVHLRDRFREAGVLAEHIDASTPVEERDAILAKLKAGAIEVVTNCMVLTEGWDCPEVSCIVLARPTKHHGLYRQMVGRVLRPASGKTNALVLDHAGLVFEHGFVEDPVTWTLDADERATLPLQAARASHKMPMLTTCPECSAVRLEGRPCPACGWRPQPKAEPLRVIEGDLGRVDRDRSVHAEAWTDKQRYDFFRELIWTCRERGWKPGAAYYKFKEKFPDITPPRSWSNAEPLVPSAATRSWLKSRSITYAKAKAKEGRA